MSSLTWMLSLSQPAVQVLQNATNTLLELGNQAADHVQLPDRDTTGAISALVTVTLALVGIFYIAPRVERFLYARLYDHLPPTRQIPAGALQTAALPIGAASQGASIRNRPFVGGLLDTSNSLSNSQSIFPIQFLDQFPDETLTRIVGYLDIRGAGCIASVCQLFRRIQGDNDVWFTILPRVRSFEVDCGLPAKERARRLLADIPLGDKETHTVCTLNPVCKTISAPHPTKQVFELALRHPKVPNGSFVVYTFGTSQIPCAVIKNTKGVVRTVHNMRIKELPDNRHLDGLSEQLSAMVREEIFAILDLRSHEGTPLQFQEFTVVLTDEQKVGNPFFTEQGQARALRLLKGTQTEDD